jgi:hypothetical protein
MLQKARRRASYYLHIVYPDHTDEIFRVVGKHGKRLAQDFEKIVHHMSREAKTERLSFPELYTLLQQKKRERLVQDLV